MTARRIIPAQETFAMFRHLAPVLAAAALVIAPGAATAQRFWKSSPQKVQKAQQKAIAKQKVQAAKDRVRVGNLALVRANTDVKRIAKNEVALRETRATLRDEFERSNLARLANPNPQTIGAWKQAEQRYLPAKAVHEKALAELTKAKGDVSTLAELRNQALNGLQSAQRAQKTPPIPNARPVIAPNARSVAPPTAPAVVARPAIVYGQLPPMRQAVAPTPRAADPRQRPLQQLGYLLSNQPPGRRPGAAGVRPPAYDRVPPEVMANPAMRAPNAAGVLPNQSVLQNGYESTSAALGG